MLDADRRALTVGLVLVVTLVAIEALAVATALPATLKDLGGVSLYGWAFSAFMLASLVGIAAAGPAADERGPAAPLTVGLVLFGAGLVVVGLAPSMPVVVGGRALQGLGTGAVPAIAYAAIGRSYPEELRPRMFAVLSSAWVVPGLAGPAAAGAVAEHLGWRWVFLGLVPMLPVAAALVLPPLRAIHGSGRRAVSHTGLAVRLATGAALVVIGLDARSPVVLVVLVVVGTLVAVPALRRLLPPGTLRAKRGLPAAVLARGLLTFPFFGAEAFLPLMLTSVRHQTTTVAGLALTAATLSWTAGAWVQERWVRRSSEAVLACTGLVFVLVGIAGVTAALFEGVPVAAAALAWAVAGLGMGLAYPMMSLVVLGVAPADEVGTASASVQLADTLGIALSTGIGGAIVAAAARGGHLRRSGILVVDVLMMSVAVIALVPAARMSASRRP